MIIFFMIFAVFDQSPLKLWINGSLFIHIHENISFILLCDAMLVRYMALCPSLRPSVSLSHVGFLSKRLNLSLRS